MAKHTKVTFTLDDQTVAALKRAARESGKPQSMIVREAVAQYGGQPDKMSPAERIRKLAIFHDVMSKLPRRPDPETDAELAELRAARRAER